MGKIIQRRLVETKPISEVQKITSALNIQDSGGTTIDPAIENGNLASILDQLDITISALRDAIVNGTTPTDLLDVNNSLTSEQPRQVSSHKQADITIHASGAETADGDSGDIDLIDYYGAEICLDVTAVSGTSPSLDVYIEGKDPESGKYKVINSHTGITATGTFWTKITDLAFRYIRARWVISGTSPSFTFSVGGSVKT